MRKYFCDRCEKEIPDGAMWYTITKEYWSYRIDFAENKGNRCNEVEHQLCIDCMQSLWNWWAEGKKND